ncbi:MAG: DUF2231 domain-containing protein [Bacteroidales bacterium]
MNSKVYKKLILYLFIIFIPLQISAHGDDDHDDSTKQDTTQTVVVENQQASDSSQAKKSTALFAGFNEFSNLHPLIVHFPIVLLLLAVFSQLVGLFVYQKPLSWVTLVLLLGGFIGGILASQFFHPHTTNLSEKAIKILEAHETYANWTVWLAGIALLFKTISHFFLSRKTWAEVIVLLLIAGSAVTVSLAGHLGSQMVFIENIGPKGQYIEQH